MSDLVTGSRIGETESGF